VEPPIGPTINGSQTATKNTVKKLTTTEAIKEAKIEKDRPATCRIEGSHNPWGKPHD